MRLSTLLAATQPVAVSVLGETVTVQVRTMAFTQEFMGRVADAGAAPWPILVEALAGWDLTDDAEQPLPITAELLAGLGLPFQAALSDALTESLLPNAQSTSPSAPS